MIDYLIKERYAVRKNGEPVEHTYNDVISRVIDWYGQDPDDLLRRKILIPATPILMNAGSPTKHPCYFSCFPLGKVGDSLDEIMETASLMARIYRSGGGCGVDISNLRKKGALVANGQGKSSGPVSFLQIFDSVTGTVSQGGRRRGALMIQCDAKHPDVVDFATCKAKEGRFANMNISLNVRDGDLDDSSLLRIVAEGMWRNGEPGVIFIDNHLRNSVIPPKEDPIYVNPCLRRGTLLFDGDRLTPIEEGGKTFKSWKTGIKKIIRLKTRDGRQIDLTPDHKVKTLSGWMKAEDCLNKQVIISDSCRINSKKFPRFIHFEVFGFVFGDGYKSKKNGKEGICVRLNPQKEPEVVKLLKDCGFKEWGRKQTKEFFTYAIDEFITQKTEEKVIPREIMCLPFDFLCSFLRGLFEANGTALAKHKRVQFKSASKILVRQIQTVLGCLGIKSYINKKCYKGTEESYNLCIGNKQSIKRFNDAIGFISFNKASKVDSYVWKRDVNVLDISKVVEIEDVGEDEVWDFTMLDGRPYNYANGFIVHNCAEYMSVAKTACNLLTLNLVEMLEKGMSESEFFKAVRKCSEKAVMFGNFILEQDEGYPNEEIRKVSQKWRPVGVGVTGLYEVMMWFGIPSADRPKFARKMQAGLWLGGRKASNLVGSNKVDLVESVFNERLSRAKALVGDDDFTVTCGGQSNCYVAVQAPTGTTSLFGGVASSGIEPVFDIPMKRMVRDGDSWKEFEVLPRVYQKAFIDRVGPAKVPVDGSEEWLSRNIPMEEHLAILEAVQDFCDAAISKTINVPNNVSVDDIEKMLRGVEKRGIKSFTVYRDGSREIQVLKHKDNGGGEEKCVAKRYKVRGPQTCYIHITEDGGKPVEVFVTAGKGGTILHADNEAIGRLASLILGDAPKLGEKMCYHLEGIDSGMMYFCDGLHGKSVQDVLAQILRRDYFSNRLTKPGGLGVCPECGKMTLKREGGCSKCLSCTYSSC